MGAPLHDGRLAAVLVLGASAGLSGCGRLKAAGDAVDEVTSPFVAQGVLLGLDLPEGVDLSDAEGFGSTALCRLLIAYVADPGELDEAPVDGASAFFRSDATGSLAFRASGDGAYELDADDGLVYDPESTAALGFDVDGSAGRMSVALPEAAELDMPGSIVRQTDLLVELDGGPWANVAAAVYDLDRGRLTWDNLPTGADEVYAFTHAEARADRIVLPAEAFARQGTYVVGVAGMAVADEGNLEGVNTSLSAFIAGRAAVELLVVTEE
jgi:hypothetical protein